MITIIAAIADNNAIGKDQQLLYTLPDDMKHFRSLTTNHTVIMGRRTWESLPIHPLPNRRNIVLTHQNNYHAPGAETFASLDEAINATTLPPSTLPVNCKLSNCQIESVFIIGGADLYAQAMPYAQRLCITHVHDTPLHADTFFPEIDADTWFPVQQHHHPADQRHQYPFTIIDYVRHPLAQFRYCPRCGSSQFLPHNAKSKHCDNCHFTYYFNPSAATVALIERQGRWLCVRRAKEPARGTLDLPGGFSDSFETSEEGVCREVLEETGLQVLSTEFLFSLPNLYVYSGFTVHTIDMFYRCRVAADAIPRPADDVSEILWLRPQDINPSDFGLASIRRGIQRLIKENSD